MNDSAQRSTGAAPGESTEGSAQRVGGKGLLVLIATERQLLLIVMIVALIAVMTVLEPTTFTR